MAPVSGKNRRAMPYTRQPVPAIHTALSTCKGSRPSPNRRTTKAS